MIKIFIADDHHLFRDGIKSFFLHEANIEIVGEAGDGLETLNMLNKMEVNVLIMDVSMPNMDGTETAETVKKLYPSIKIIMLTMHDTIN